LFSTLPTATNSDLAGKHWTLGPEAVLGHVGEKLIVFAFRRINGMSQAGATTNSV
jgi:hypothetical protein